VNGVIRERAVQILTVQTGQTAVGRFDDPTAKAQNAHGPQSRRSRCAPYFVRGTRSIEIYGIGALIAAIIVPVFGKRQMRVYFILAGLALLLVGRGSATVVVKGSEAQRSCQLLVQESFRDQGEARSAGSCEGMIETAMLFSPNLPAEVRACPPAQGSVLQSAKVLLRYLDKNPDRVSEPGITIAIEAFRDAWPCHGDDAGPSMGTKPTKRSQKKPKQ